MWTEPPFARLINRRDRPKQRALDLCAVSRGLALRGRVSWGISAGWSTAISQTAESARVYLADTTLGDWSRPLGTQIEYLAANGRAYLWYLGNRKPVSGEWITRNARLGAAEICFRYGANAYNPVTRTSGGSWECQGVYQYTAWNFEWVVGDPFHLESGRLPFVLPLREHVILTAAVDRAGYSQNVLKWKQGGYSLRNQ